MVNHRQAAKLARLNPGGADGDKLDTWYREAIAALGGFTSKNWI